MHIERQPEFQAVRIAALPPGAAGVDTVVALVSRHANVPLSMIFSHSRCRLAVARARQLAMYLSHVILGHSLTTVGAAFGRDRTTVSHACGLIEDMRDDPHFDAEVTALELSLQESGL